MNVDDLLRGRPARSAAAGGGLARTATVVRSDDTGVWCTPLGGDSRHPVGPCRGAHRPALTGPPDARQLTAERLPEGALVLLVTTAHGPWVAAWEE
jgi:hypothetical protein